MCRVSYKRILIVISHSQDFLNGICTNIIHMHLRKLYYYGVSRTRFISSYFTSDAVYSEHRALLVTTSLWNSLSVPVSTSINDKAAVELLYHCRDANVPTFGGIFPLYNRFYAIPSGNDEIPLFTDFLAQVSHVNDDVGKF